MADRMISRLRVRPGSRVTLSRWDPRADFGWDKAQARAEIARLAAEMAVLQAKLYAESRRCLLVVLQARDAAGKDGVIRSVFTGLNPAGVRVTSFKAPTGRELAQDYLWRCHAAVPARGEIGIFNRSHYEDVLAARVHNLVPEERWRKRYRHIREFEQMLADEGTSILKIFLDISKDEQRRRFQDRIDDPNERWKFRLGDLDDRKMWDAYTAAYEEAIGETSTEDAPWFVVPADRKWVRDLAVSRLLVAALERIGPRFPEPEENLKGLRVT